MLTLRVPKKSHPYPFLGLALIAMVGASACESELGVPGGAETLGGSSSASFTGIETATSLSPTVVKISWNSSSQYSLYKVYSAGSSAPLATSLFSSATITGLTPGTTYSFSVEGLPTDGGNPYGSAKSIDVTTLSQFSGIKSLTAASSSNLIASWNYSATTATFSVFVNEGSVPTNFNTPDAITQAFTAGISTWGGGNPLGQDKTYYAVVRATFADGTVETNSTALSVKTPSLIDPLPTVSAPVVSLGPLPIISVSGAISEYTTTFTNSTGTVLGTIKGNGSFRIPTSKALSPGSNVIKASVEYKTYVTDLPDVSIFVRGLSTNFNDAPLLSSGKGMQGLGTMMSVGDFNCDGYDDLAVSAPLGTFFTADNADSKASQGLRNGGVYVFYGCSGSNCPTGSGLSSGLIIPTANGAVPAPSTNPTGKNPLFIPFPANVHVPNPFLHQYFGISLAAGNINGDAITSGPNTYHCDDLVIGAPHANTQSIYTGWTGAVFVYYGSSSGLQIGTPLLNAPACSGSGACNPQEISPAMGASGEVQPNEYARFGYAVTLGDFKGAANGTHGLAVSAVHYTGDTSGNFTSPQYGRVYVFDADSTGVKLGAAANQYAKTLINAPNTVTYLNTSPLGLGFGSSLAALDIDGNGADDLLVGSPADAETIGGTPYTNRGSVYVYKSAVTTQIPNLPAPDAVLRSGIDPATYTAYGGGKSLFFGGQLIKAGDINLDGVPDLVVTNNTSGLAAHSSTTPPLVTVFYGESGTGLQTGNGIAVNANACTAGCVGPTCATCKIQSFTNASSWLANGFGGFSGDSTKAYWGLSAAGAKTQNNTNGTDLLFGGQKINNDSYADVIIGHPGAGSSFQGTGNVLYGSKNGLISIPSVITPATAQENDGTGFSVAVGNFNGASFSSVALGSPFNSGLGNGSYGGVVYTFDASSSGVPAQASIYKQLVKVNNSVEVPGVQDSIAPVQVLAAGDLNGDGYTDAIYTLTLPAIFPGINHSYEARPTDTYIKVAIVYYGSANGLIVSPVPSLEPVHATDPLLIVPPTSSGCGDVGQYSCYDSNFASYLFPVGDVNGDGFDDVMLSNGTIASIYYGSNSGLQHASPPQATTSSLDPRIVSTSLTIAGSPNFGFTHSSIAHGDFNGDGFEDVAIGNKDYGGYPDNTLYHGSVLILYGSTEGLQTDGVAAPCSGAAGSSGTRAWSNGAVTALCNVANAFNNPCDGSASNPSCVAQHLAGLSTGVVTFASTVANAGDINADGYDDLIVGSPYDDTNGADNGSVLVYYGSARGLAVGSDGRSIATVKSGSPLISPVLIAPPLITVIGSPRYLGATAVAGVGDVNGDGFMDIAIGDPSDNAGGQSALGGGFLFYGCEAGSNGCPNTGIWGVSYSSGTFSTVAYSSSCSAGGSCIVKNTSSCLSSGVCSPLFFSPPTNAGGHTNITNVGILLNGIGDVNKDSYSDLVIAGRSYGSSTATSSGGFALSSIEMGLAIIYAGSVNGLVTGTPSTQPTCTSGSGCTPYFLQPETSGWGDTTQPAYFYLGYNQNLMSSPRKSVDFNGDGYPDFLLKYYNYWNQGRTSFGLGGFVVFQ